MLKPVHDRMPVILAKDAEVVCLDPGIQDAAFRLLLLTQCPAHETIAYPVSKQVNTTSSDRPECVEPLRPGRS